METYSGPTTVNDADQRAARKPAVPLEMMSTQSYARHRTFKTAEGASGTIFGKTSRVVPITEAVCIVGRVASDHGNECEGEQQQNQDDFSTAQPELSLSREKI
jgi:hypothetical protein